MGAGIGLFLGWENGIGVTGTGIWPLRLGYLIKIQLGLGFWKNFWWEMGL